MLESAETALANLEWWAQAGLVLAASVFIARLLAICGSILLGRSERLVESGRDEMLVRELRLPLYATIIFSGAFVAAQFLPEGSDPDVTLPPGLTPSEFVTALAFTVLVVFWARAGIRIGDQILSPDKSKRAAQQDAAPIVANLLNIGIVVFGVLVLLSVWQVDATPLLASAGVIGIILGVAAQDSLGNFFGGLSLYFDEAYELGDMVKVESEDVRGTVVDISIRSTTLLTRDDVAITIPNAQMNSAQVTNESAPRRQRRIRFDVSVAYGSELDAVERAILDAAEMATPVIEEPEPRVRFREFGDSAIIAQLHAYIHHPAQREDAKDQLVRNVDEQFHDAEIKIPFPQRELSFFESGNELALEGARGQELDSLDIEHREADPDSNHDDTTSTTSEQDDHESLPEEADSGPQSGDTDHNPRPEEADSDPQSGDTDHDPRPEEADSNPRSENANPNHRTEDGPVDRDTGEN